MRKSSASTLAVTALLGGVALAGPAHAAPAETFMSPGVPPSTQTQDLRSPDTRDAAAGVRQDLRSPDARDAAVRGVPQAPSVPAVTTVVAEPSGSGFDWGSAAIGAAAGLGLTALMLGGVLVSRRRRHPLPATPAIGA